MRLVRHFDESTGQIYVAVNELEPNHRLASALKLVVVAVGFAAILTHLMR
jgi:hypothetical protein